MNCYSPLCLIGENADMKIERSLSERGFNVYRLPKYMSLPMAISSHTDTLIFAHKNNVFCSCDYYNTAAKNIFDMLSTYDYKIILCDTLLGNTYPDDIAFNAFCIGDKLYGKLDNIAREIKEYSDKFGMKKINLKQGYAKCSSLILGDIGIITADNGIAKAAKAEKINVLKISNSPEAVKLCGYDYGFIGGACGIYENTVYFTGNIGMHPDGASIIDFCERLGFKIVCLSDDRLCDIGGIMFFDCLSNN